MAVRAPWPTVPRPCRVWLADWPVSLTMHAQWLTTRALLGRRKCYREHAGSVSRTAAEWSGCWSGDGSPAQIMAAHVLRQVRLQVRLGDEFYRMPGRVLEIDSATTVFGVGLATALHLGIGPVLDALLL